MYAYGVTLNEGFYDLGVAVFDAPDQNATVSVVADHTVLNRKSAQFANYADCFLVFVAFYLGVCQHQVPVFLDPDCWDGGIA